MTTAVGARIARQLLACAAALAFGGTALPALAAPQLPSRTPNILFFIMDDVGIDQMKAFGYGGATPPHTPNIDAIAKGGVRFRNTWAMSECSPSRSAMFTGRWPLRTGVEAVISSTVLANSQLSPFEVTVPKLLRSGKAHYASAMFGKFHLGGPDNYPFDNGGPHALGFDHFYGWIEGEPYPIDTWAGQVPPSGSTSPGPYACGFVPGTTAGACRFASGACEPANTPRPALDCMTRGGVFDQGGACGSPPLHDLDFDTANGYYVSPLVINRRNGSVEAVHYPDPRARGYRTTLEVNAARDWIRTHNPGEPWMATVSFSSAHVPLQPPPPALLPAGTPDASATDCTSMAATRVLSNQTIEAMDTELGRLLFELGLATRDPAGLLVYDPAASNTMIVIVGDNGTYAPFVKTPFDPVHSKGTPYQTGVWVPLIVAGPLVNTPDREIRHMINVADLFALFGEIAQVDVRRAVPRSHILDAAPMLAYLTDPGQASLRQDNFTQGGTSITKNNVQPGPCVIPVEGGAKACVQLFPTAAICGSEGGVWWGSGSPDPQTSCCGVAPSYAGQDFMILPPASRAIRNDRFKLLQKDTPDCSSSDPNATITVTEFYEIDEVPVAPRIDRPDSDTLANNLLPNGAPPSTLPPLLKANFDSLYVRMQRILASEVPCPGDGNLDKKVDVEDLVLFEYFRFKGARGSSWYDFNYDALTNREDREVILRNFGTDCLRRR